MFTNGVAISWMVLSPLALISDVIAIISIGHYLPFLHGTDVTILSVLAAMAGNAILVLPIPAYLSIKETQWYPNLCTGYVWCFLTFKVAQTFSVCVMCIHWSTVLKMSVAKKTYVTTKFLKIAIVFIWIFSATFGLLPVIGVASEDFNESNTCKFLGFNLGTGFSLFFLVFNVTATFVSIICAADATVLIKNMKIVAKTKYQDGRFHIPDKRADIPNHGGPGNVIDRYHRLTFAWDLSKFVLALAVFVGLMDLLPYTIIQGLQLFSQADRVTLETATLYMSGFESLLLPALLWTVSRRYRHAIVYQTKIYILRQKEVTEDPCSCVLQSYTPRDKDRLSVGPSRPPSSLSRAGGFSASGTLRSTKSAILSSDSLHIHTNGRSQITTISGEHNDVRPMNGVIKSEVRVETHIPNQVYNERSIDADELELKVTARSPISDHSFQDSVRKVSEASSSTTSDPSSSKGKSLVIRQDIKRSSSGTSRKDWKDQMKKKHLPPIFINEGFDSEDQRNREQRTSAAAAAVTPTHPRLGKAGHQHQGSLHYYLSSDYHPDYLTDSLPRHKLKSQSFESESEGASGVYNDDDIGDVLDHRGRDTDDLRAYGDTETDGDSAVRSYSGPQNRRPFLSTFQPHVSSDKDDDVKHKTGNAKGVYSTFEDLRSSSDLRDENEITFDMDSIPIDNIQDGYNSLKGVKRKPNSTGGYDWRNKPKYPTDFQDDIYRARLASVISPRFMMFDKYDAKTNPFYTIDGVQMATTSFGRTGSFDSRVKKGSAAPGDSYQENEPYRLKVDDYLKKNYISEANINNETNSNDVSNNVMHPRYSTNTNTLVLNGKTDHTSESSTDRVNGGITRTEDGNESSGSGSSVTLSPYKPEMHKRPWLEDYDASYDVNNVENMQMIEPLVEESDNETLRDESNDWRYGDAAKNSHSELSTPVSSIFDEETDRGFEEALDAHASAASVYGGVGLCFESIKEEPEEMTSSGSNPFLDNVSYDGEFKTQAVVSRNSRPNSRTSSCTSVSDNPFSSSPKQAYASETGFYGNGSKARTPIIVTSDIGLELGDSGFTSGLEKESDSSGHQESRSGKTSPWPDENCGAQSACADHSFESDFTGNPFETSATFDHQRNTSDKYRVYQQASDNAHVSLSHDRKLHDATSCHVIEKHAADAKKPMHKSVMGIRTQTTKQAPVRVRSLDAASPLSPRRPPKRGSSFEGLRTDIRPAYF